MPINPEPNTDEKITLCVACTNACLSYSQQNAE
jgi:hypothetical protein